MLAVCRPRASEWLVRRLTNSLTSASPIVPRSKRTGVGPEEACVGATMARAVSRTSTGGVGTVLGVGALVGVGLAVRVTSGVVARGINGGLGSALRTALVAGRLQFCGDLGT